MITTMTLLALVCDWGYSNFPNSTLNWWTWVFMVLGGFTAVVHIHWLNEMRNYFVGPVPFRLVGPLIIDLLIAVSVTFIYSVFLVSP